MNRWVKTLVSSQVQIAMTYKVPFFISMFVFIFPLLAKIMLWKAIYNSQPAGATMGGFDLKDMITYYFVFQIVFEITWCFIDGHRIIPHIVQGELTRYLLLPVYYPFYVAMEYFGAMFVTRFFSAILIFPVLMLCFIGDISLHLNLTAIVLGIISLALGCVFSFTFYMCAGLVAFWLEDRPPFTDLLVSFMGGMMIPIDIMPHWLQKISAILPFQYRMYLPTKILMGKMTLSEALPGMAVQIAWILVFILLIKLLWRSGIKRYQAYGG